MMAQKGSRETWNRGKTYGVWARPEGRPVFRTSLAPPVPVSPDSFRAWARPRPEPSCGVGILKEEALASAVQKLQIWPCLERSPGKTNRWLPKKSAILKTWTTEKESLEKLERLPGEALAGGRGISRKTGGRAARDGRPAGFPGLPLPHAAERGVTAEDGDAKRATAPPALTSPLRGPAGRDSHGSPSSLAARASQRRGPPVPPRRRGARLSARGGVRGARSALRRRRVPPLSSLK
eukprot:gene15169-biopygen9221